MLSWAARLLARLFSFSDDGVAGFDAFVADIDRWARYECSAVLRRSAAECACAVTRRAFCRALARGFFTDRGVNLLRFDDIDDYSVADAQLAKTFGPPDVVIVGEATDMKVDRILVFVIF